MAPRVIDPPRAKAAGFRWQTPSRGSDVLASAKSAKQWNGVIFAQCGRIARRGHRSANRFLGWIELAAGVIFIRSGFIGSS
jgi:hypothetical protein